MNPINSSPHEMQRISGGHCFQSPALDRPRSAKQAVEVAVSDRFHDGRGAKKWETPLANRQQGVLEEEDEG
jgi:hypothetical protein